MRRKRPVDDLVHCSYIEDRLRRIHFVNGRNDAGGQLRWILIGANRESHSGLRSLVIVPVHLRASIDA